MRKQPMTSEQEAHADRRDAYSTICTLRSEIEILKAENADLRSRIVWLEATRIPEQEVGTIGKKAIYCASSHCDCDQSEEVRRLLRAKPQL